MHTGRSRNDQVATDLRLYLRAEVAVIRSLLVQNMQALVTLAEREAGSVMPGFTHLQGAQPITFGHHMLAWYEMLKRDEQRLRDCLERINVLPLGAAALAGTRFPIDRSLTAELLDFPAIAGELAGRGQRPGFCGRVLRRRGAGHVAPVPVFRGAGAVAVSCFWFYRYR